MSGAAAAGGLQERRDGAQELVAELAQHAAAVGRVSLLDRVARDLPALGERERVEWSSLESA